MSVLICGQNNNNVLPIKLCNSGCIITATANSNNKPLGNCDSKILLCGLYRNQIIPVLVNNDGELL